MLFTNLTAAQPQPMSGATRRTAGSTNRHTNEGDWPSSGLAWTSDNGSFAFGLGFAGFLGFVTLVALVLPLFLFDDELPLLPRTFVAVALLILALSDVFFDLRGIG